MEIIFKVIIYWDIAMWVMGAVFTTALLIIGLMWAYSTLFKGWGEKVANDFRLHLWLYRGMRAWERAGNPRPDGQTMTEEQKLKQSLRELLVLAMEHGYVITVENKPREPLAMGNSYMAFDVRPTRNHYQKDGAA